MEEQAKKQTGIKGYLDNVFSSDGLKTDIKISMTDDTYIKLISAGLAIAFGGSIIVFGLKAIIKNIQRN